MAVTFGAIGANNTAVGTADRTPTLPSGVVADSVVIDTVTVNLAGATAAAPTNYTQIAAQNTASPTLRVHSHRASGAESGTVTTPHGGNAGSTSDAYLVRIDGAATTGAITGQQTSAQATSASTSSTVSLTGTTAGGLLVFVVSYPNSRTITSVPSGFTQRSAGSALRMHFFTMANPSGGNTGSLSTSWSGGDVASSTILFEILPVVVTGSATLAETATLSSTGVAGVVAAATLAVTATLAATGAVGAVSDSTLNETATITSSGLVAANAAAPLPITATITPTGVVNRDGSASLPITATVTATGSKVIGSAATQAITATITATGGVTLNAAATLPVTVSTTTTGGLGGGGTAILAVTATTSTTGQVTGSGAAALTVNVAPTAAGTINTLSAATVPVVTTITASGDAYGVLNFPKNGRATIATTDSEADILPNDAKAVIA